MSYNTKRDNLCLLMFKHLTYINASLLHHKQQSQHIRNNSSELIERKANVNRDYRNENQLFITLSGMLAS